MRMSAPVPIDSWYLDHLACPRDHGSLQQAGAVLVCAQGHRYPIVAGIPVMLLSDVPHTIDIAGASLRQAGDQTPADPLFLETLSLSADEKRGIAALAGRGGPIDPVVAYLVAATNGLMYRHLIGRLVSYPIPEIALPPGNGRTLLDIGCSWGRWSLAASSRGYATVGIDPSLGAVLAAQRVAQQLGRHARFVVGDARHLPFRNHQFAITFSYSVIQHFSKDDAARALAEMGRVLVPGGQARVQMPTRFGLRCLYHQFRRGFRAGTGFDVRYWTLPELGRAFAAAIGPNSLDADCFFGIGLQPSDAALMTPARRLVLRASSMLTAASVRIPALLWVADSVFVRAKKAG